MLQENKNIQLKNSPASNSKHKEQFPFRTLIYIYFHFYLNGLILGIESMSPVILEVHLDSLPISPLSRFISTRLEIKYLFLLYHLHYVQSLFWMPLFLLHPYPTTIFYRFFLTCLLKTPQNVQHDLLLVINAISSIEYPNKSYFILNIL